MELDCPRCTFPVPIRFVPSRCGAIEYDALCPRCGQEFSGAVTFAAPPSEEL
jgi:hypothetical protein